MVAAVGGATVGEVLGTAPATQGLASVVGLLSLAVANGRVDSNATERVRWSGVDGVERVADVTTHVFDRRIG